jgi:hypothetical protein
MKRVFLSFGSGMVELTDQNEDIVKHFLYSNFPPDKIIKIRDENGKTRDKLRLDELFNKNPEK